MHAAGGAVWLWARIERGRGLRVDVSTLAGLRDRALVGVSWSTVLRASARHRQMRVEDVYVQGRRTWIRLHEKGGKVHEMLATTPSTST